jgi:hypothetical protein
MLLGDNALYVLRGQMVYALRKTNLELIGKTDLASAAGSAEESAKLPAALPRLKRYKNE